MPMSGTPIGLAGPPHVPLGVPAGLQANVIVNHTSVVLPQPVQERADRCPAGGRIRYPAAGQPRRIVERGQGGLQAPASSPLPNGGTGPRAQRTDGAA